MIALTLTQGLQAVALMFGLVLSVGGLAGMVWAVARVKGMEVVVEQNKATLELIQTGNEELRTQLEDARLSLVAERHDCSTRIANLEGQLSMLTGGLAEQIIRAVTEALMKGARR